MRLIKASGRGPERPKPERGADCTSTYQISAGDRAINPDYTTLGPYNFTRLTASATHSPGNGDVTHCALPLPLRGSGMSNAFRWPSGVMRVAARIKVVDKYYYEVRTKNIFFAVLKQNICQYNLSFFLTLICEFIN